ncbi:MAG: DUF5677 domain-containing protein [Nitrospira sp.]|nr:DUF5677 domain-containing protein [Nitrospira sp.]
MSLHDEGFLSHELDAVRVAIRKHHAKHFDLTTRVNIFCQETRARMGVYNRDPQQLIATCLMLKIFEDVQGALLLLESGLGSQSRSLLRVATEALIILAKVVGSEEFFKAYVLAGQRERLKLLMAIKSNRLYGSEDIQKDITPGLLEQVKKSFDGTENKNLERWAKDVKLDVMYDIVYRLFSQDVHTHPRRLEKYLIIRADGEIGQIGWGAGIGEDISIEIVEAAKILLLTMDAIGHLFQLQIKEEIKSFWEEIKRLVELNNNDGRPELSSS